MRPGQVDTACGYTPQSDDKALHSYKARMIIWKKTTTKHEVTATTPSGAIRSEAFHAVQTA